MNRAAFLPITCHRTDDASLQILRLCSLGQVSKAISYLHSLPLKSPINNKAYASLFINCARHGLLSLGKSVHDHYISSPFPKPNTIITNHLINMYSKCGDVAFAHKLFDQMSQKNLVSWTALVSGYSHNELHSVCMSLFSEMVLFHLPNDFAFSTVLSSCAKSQNLSFGKQVHALAFKTSFSDNVFIGNALITMYCSCSNEDGWNVFESMSFHNVITWNSMIAGFNMMGQFEKSLHLFARMYSTTNVGFDRATLLAVASSCLSMKQLMQMLALAIKTDFVSEAELATVFMRSYSNLGGDFNDCYKIFSEINVCDMMSWTAVIAVCAEQNRPEEALSLFIRLRKEGFKPDCYILSSVVKACAGFATELQCSSLHSLLVRLGFNEDTIICNALVHSYSRCGCIGLAEKTFEEVQVRDKVSWNSIIKANAIHGRGKEALLCFKQMDVYPDSATFAAVLTACSHAGLIEEGRDVFKSMSEVYGINPQLDHFACMVDILGRTGKLEEAEALIDQMPMNPDSVVWCTLLGACRKKGESKIGNKAARKLVELDPQKSSSYVMLSNIYSARGSFVDAAIVRKEMKDSGVKKELGLSWISIKNRVHEFSAGGRYHFQIEEIYLELKALVDELKKIGYVVDTKLVLHEIDEEHKEERLLHHSEKLALVYGLMNTTPSQKQLKIMKNIRICKDCHRFMKVASKYVGKEIVVRDSIRFHHFVDGDCSCGDYW